LSHSPVVSGRRPVDVKRPLIESSVSLEEMARRRAFAAAVSRQQ
jgi:hypothetical protein